MQEPIDRWSTKVYRANFEELRKDIVLSNNWLDTIIYLKYAVPFGQVTLTLIDGEPKKITEISREVLVEKLSIIVPMES